MMGDAMLKMLQGIRDGEQPKAQLRDLGASEVRAKGRTLRALLAGGYLTTDAPFVYRLTDKGREALGKGGA